MLWLVMIPRPINVNVCTHVCEDIVYIYICQSSYISAHSQVLQLIHAVPNQGVHANSTPWPLSVFSWAALLDLSSIITWLNWEDHSWKWYHCILALCTDVQEAHHTYTQNAEKQEISCVWNVVSVRGVQWWASCLITFVQKYILDFQICAARGGDAGFLKNRRYK